MPLTFAIDMRPFKNALDAMAKHIDSKVLRTAAEAGAVVFRDAMESAAAGAPFKTRTGGPYVRVTVHEQAMKIPDYGLAYASLIAGPRIPAEESKWYLRLREFGWQIGGKVIKSRVKGKRVTRHEGPGVIRVWARPLLIPAAQAVRQKAADAVHKAVVELLKRAAAKAAAAGGAG